MSNAGAFVGRGPDSATAAVRAAVRAELADLSADAVVLVACSGGPDSLALAAALAFVASSKNGPAVRAGAVVVDHRWHRKSAAVADDAARACRELGLNPVQVLTVLDAAAASNGAGPEASARTARYALVDAAAAEQGAAAVLLGHTADDQAETVLLGMARGSGTRALAGMPRRRGVYRRPLLGISRDLTHASCAALGLAPWHDPSNADPRFARARIRAAMATLEASLGPGFAAALGRTADLAGVDADALDAQAERAFECMVGLAAGGGIRLLIAEVEPLPSAIRHRVWLLAFRDAGCPPAAISSAHVYAVDALITDWHGQGSVALPGGLAACRVNQVIEVC